MEQIISLIKDTLSSNATIKDKLNTTNNQVYIIEDSGKEYILKLYKSKHWPEDGKNIFVNSLLENNKIRHAKVIDYNRNCSFSQGGYILEEKISGNPIDLNSLTIKEGMLYYKYLAQFIKKVHSITFEKYGWINNGNPYYESFSDFLLSEIQEHSENLIKAGVINETLLVKICNTLKAYFDKLNTIPCLCHGDLSLRNAIWDGENLTLIDYDDVMILPNYADIARLTFDMRSYSNFAEFRKIFLETYFVNTEENNIFERFEKMYHLYCCIDWIDFNIKKGYDYNYLLKYLKQLINEIIEK